MATPILAAGAASLFTGAAGIFPEQADLLFALGAILGLFASFAPRFPRAREKQESWVRTRVATEVCRSFVALWDTPMSYDVVDKFEMPELGGMLDSLNHLKILAGYRLADSDLSAFKTSYRESRINHQASYFEKESDRAARALLRSGRFIHGFVACAILGFLLVMASRIFHFFPDAWMSWVVLGIGLAFQAAAGTGALMVINDYHRREKRYREIRRLIEIQGQRLEQAQTWTSVLRIVKRIERTLLTEVIEWRALFQNQEFGK